MRRPTLEFLTTEAGAGLILGVAAILAIVAANSTFAADYFAFIHSPFTVQIGGFRQTATVLDWVEQGLMAVFFLVVGLELKYEAVKGELANPRRLAAPLLAAVAGMAVPALIYGAVNLGQPPVHGAWATPTPTDIAFSLAALSVVSRRLPGSLRVFLLTLAMADDLGAIGLMGALFSHGVRPLPLACAFMVLLGMAALGRWRSAPFLAYAVGFILVWGFTLKSGVPTALAGMAAAMTVPMGAHRRAKDGMLQQMMQSLHPYVAYLVLPLFAFVASGVALHGLGPHTLARPALLGILAGLLIGKPTGVFLATLLAVTLGLGRKPTGATWLEILGVAMLCGMGFTMSLFIGAMAFPEADAASQADLRIGVTLASLLSGLLGMALLGWSGARRARTGSPDAP